jgi:transcriptional regulator GlxA family with amidase domain
VEVAVQAQIDTGGPREANTVANTVANTLANTVANTVANSVASRRRLVEARPPRRVPARPEPEPAARLCPRRLTRRRVAVRAQIAVFDGFDPLDAVAAHEVLSAGGLASGGALAVELVSPAGPGPVTAGAGGLVVRATGTFDPDHADLVVVPGPAGPAGRTGLAPPDRVLDGILDGVLDGELPVLLKHALDDPDVVVAAVGGGALLLAAAGLIEGRHAVTHPPGMHLLDATGAVAVDARVVDDGDLVTAGGVMSGIDLGLYLLERELGPRVALSVERLFGYERRGTAWRRAGADPVL